jgi:hypothetical protein
MSTKVFKYGLQLGDAAMREQMRKGRGYYNKLVEAENERKKKIWEDDRIPEAPHPPTENEKGETVFCKCQECKAFWKEMRSGYFKANKIIGPLDKKSLREQAAADGLYWGTYLLVERAFDRAVSDTKWYNTVKFRSWKQGGYMGVEIQDGVDHDKMFRIEKAPDSRTGKRAGQRHTLQIKTGSNSWSDPVSFEMHRPLLGRVTWVQVSMKYRGEREEWSVSFTSEKTPARTDNALEGVVAIDVGWRIMPDNRIRLAFAKGDNGNEYEYWMPERWRELSDRADRIRGYRDTMLNVIKARHPVLRKHKKPRGARDHIRRAGLDKDIELLGWLRWDKHMEDYELGCRRRSKARRQNDLRVWLRMLRRRYATAIIKDSAHKELKDHKRAVRDGMLPRSRRNAHHGAPGEVIAEVLQVFDRKTGVYEIEASQTTATCNTCGHVNEVGPELIMQCEQCGTRGDRDRVSTRNLLDRYFAGEFKKPTARKNRPKYFMKHDKIVLGEQRLRDGL